MQHKVPAILLDSACHLSKLSVHYKSSFIEGLKEMDKYVLFTYNECHIYYTEVYKWI